MAGITRNPYSYPYGNFPGAPVQQMPGYQMPTYGWPGMQQPVQQPGPAAQMSKPTVHADIIQVENEAAGENEPVDAGTSQMMITKDETTILIKSTLANGETTIDIYRKQPKTPKKPEPEYVTRAEFEQRIAEMIRPEPEPIRQPLRMVEPELPEPDYEEPGYEAPAPRTVSRTRNTGGTKRR